jgi:putative heme iron utilization protein
MIGSRTILKNSGVILRQKIVDYLIEHPDSTPSDVHAALNCAELDTVSRALGSMCKAGELERDRPVKSTRCGSVAYRYTSLVDRAGNIVREPKQKPVKIERKGYYCNKWGQHDYKGQGGQGGAVSRFLGCPLTAIV